LYVGFCRVAQKKKEGVTNRKKKKVKNVKERPSREKGKKGDVKGREEEKSTTQTKHPKKKSWR